MAYATPADLIKRHDARLIAELVSDDGEAVDAGDLDSNINLLTALADASAEVESALISGGRYTTEQLDSIPDRTRPHLVSIVCRLAIAALNDRRPESSSKDWAERISKLGRDAVEQLRKGVNVLGLAQVEAGRVEVSGPTVIQLVNRNDITVRARRHFIDPATRQQR